MRLATYGFMPAMALTLGACQGAIWGNLCVFAISVGIFMGTLSLGRTPR